MSIGELPDRPTLQPVGQEVEVEEGSWSILAIAAFLVGLLSLASFMSSVFLALAAVSMVLGVLALIRIGKKSNIAGRTLAQLGVGFGLLAVIGAVTFSQQSEEYLYRVAGGHAETFLSYFTNDDKYYEALELLKSEPYRQITGTNLKAYYENASEQVLSGLEGFKREAATQLVLENKDAADWKYQHGVSLRGTHDNLYVEVALRNEAPGQGQIVHVTLQRHLGVLVDDEGAPTAHWNVYSLEFP
jgi:hypothetical protein